VLVYGEPGSGKTTFAGTCIKKFKPIILSAESGLLSLRDMGDFDYIKIEKFQDLIDAHDYLALKDNPYDTVIIDSLTEIQQECMAHIIQSKDDEVVALGDYKLPNIKDWGALGSVMTKTIKYFRNMDKNLIVTALADRVTNEETLETKIQPSLQGKLKDTVAAYFDEVLYLHTRERIKDDKKETVHVISTENNGKWIAKDRSGKLASLVKPDFCEIYEAIYG